MTNNTLDPNEMKYGPTQQNNSVGYNHNLSNNLSTDIENTIGTHSRVRSPTLRRGSISLSAVVHHRRALFGALISRMGSNISLPSTLDQDLTLNNSSVYNQIAQIAPLNLTEPIENLDSGNNNLEELLKLTSANTENIPLSNLNVNGSISVNTVQNQSCPKRNSHAPHAEFISSISILYAKLLIVVGVAIPVTASVSQQVPPALDQGFYLYLYIVSVVFLITLYSTLLRDKAVKNLLVKHAKREERYNFNDDSNMEISMGDDYKQTVKNHFHRRQVQQYGSFCLRLGTVGFGAGSLVFTGLQIGAEIVSGPFRAITPTARLLLVMAQMHFIFLNSKCLELTKHGAFAKLGLMHMIATNLCEWLQALVEETQHEIVQLEHAHEGDDGILKTLLRDASPFLFPCTIEFSLICAVILFEMWKCVDKRVTNSTKYESSARSLHHLSIDCGSAHRGLFGGILIIAATVLSLIMFFVLKDSQPKIAIQQVTALEIAIQISGALAAIGAALKLQNLEHKNTKPPRLDATLLAAAQAGVYLHSFFGAVGGILTRGPIWGLLLGLDFLALLQSTIQTLLIKIAWRRRSTTKEKPGKELITFLIVVNVALWTVNTFEKSRAGVRPDHLRFFGVWAWTIIIHVSMPLAIFYRFHSAICLFEVWKSCYKYRPLGDHCRSFSHRNYIEQ